MVLLPIITFIALSVLGLLIYVAWRFNENANPVPSKLTHHTGLEIIWTLVPVLILVFIAIPSFRLLAHQVEIPPAKITIKVTGNQWYWSYKYPEDQGGGFGFDKVMKPEADLQPGDVRLLSVDNEAVVPVNEVVKLQITASDVIHSFTIPAFSIRMDAVPGRLNETGSRRKKKAFTTVSAQRFAARITLSCRPRSEWSAGRNTKSGLRRRKRSSQPRAPPAVRRRRRSLIPNKRKKSS